MMTRITLERCYSKAITVSVDHGMGETVLEVRRYKETIPASVNRETREVTFDSKVVTGKMRLTSPDKMVVEVVARGGKYYLVAVP